MDQWIKYTLYNGNASLRITRQFKQIYSTLPRCSHIIFKVFLIFYTHSFLILFMGLPN